MKTSSKILNRSALVLATAFLFCAAKSNAATSSLEIPASNGAIELTETDQDPPSTLQIVSFTPFLYNGNVNIRCNGTNTGRVTIQVTGGVPPYTYSWSSGSPLMGGIMAIGLSAGNVTCTVTDAVGNSVSQSATLIENPPLQGIANVSPILCNGGVATIALDATGGTMPYNGLSWYQFTAGTYSFTIADANGCRDEVITEITEPPVLEATATVVAPILCHGDVTSVIVEATGGVGSYNGAGVYNEFAGTSSYTITDGNGCFAYASVSINQPPVFVVEVNSAGISCRGGDSEVSVSGLGGVTPYTNTGTFSQPAGNYNYTIYDANGCQASTAITITQPAALVAAIYCTSIACNGDLSQVDLIASGGTAPYIGPGTFFEPAGYYTYTVEDANGCTVDIEWNIVEPREIELEVSWSPIQGSTGTTDVLVVADGGTPAYMGTGIFMAGPGSHVYTVTDANGCTGSESIVISNPITTPQNSDPVFIEQSHDLKSGNVQGAFNTSTNEIEISYELAYDSEVNIEIYDMSGALVESIEQDEVSLEGESYLVSIDSDKFTTGVYLYHFVTHSERQVGKLQIVR